VLDCGCFLLSCDCERGGCFDGATLEFSVSLRSICDFGTTPPVRRVHFFLDFIFH
jgi:hypothetical protein